MRYSPAVVIPNDRPASLGIARSLGRRGIPIYGVDANPLAVGMASRYVKACPLPNSDASDQNRLQYLIELGKKLGERAVLFPVSDDAVILCSQYRNELQEYYVFTMPEHATISSLLTKDGLHEMAQKCDVPDPQMFRINTHVEVEKLSDQLPYPVIIKPVFSPSWLKPEITSILRDDPLSGAPKVAFCRNAEELLRKYDRIAAHDNQVIIQEVIPGEDERLVYFCFYLDSHSKPLATFAGEKLRVLPVGFGSASYVRSFHDPKLEEVSFKLLNGTHYQGLGGIEFKRDSRDGCYKLIEFNARLGMWDCLGARCGVDIPYVAYCDTLGLSVKAQCDYRDGVLWVDFQRDVRAFLIYRRHKQLSFFRWLRSLLGEKDWAIYASDDWKPIILALRELFQRPWESLKKRLHVLQKLGS